MAPGHALGSAPRLLCDPTAVWDMPATWFGPCPADIRIPDMAGLDNLVAVGGGRRPCILKSLVAPAGGGDDVDLELLRRLSTSKIINQFFSLNPLASVHPSIL